MKNFFRVLCTMIIFLSMEGCGTVDKKSDNTSQNFGNDASKNTQRKPDNPLTIESSDSSQNISESLNDPIYQQSTEVKQGLIISEFMAANVNTKMDPDFHQFSDWIELYNNSEKTIDIGGYRITHMQNMGGWQIPSKTLPAHSFVVLWADKADTKYHTDFSLSSKGDSVFLYNPNGQLIDSVVFGKQKGDISAGRDLKTFKWGYMFPTLGTSNNMLIPKIRSKKPLFSSESGFYSHSIKITLAAPDSEIHYTVDGSIPTMQSPVYNSAILLDSNTVIRAIAYKNGFLPSKVVTKTYFINESAMEKSPFPVVSLSVNSDYLFDKNYGIYVEGTENPSSGSMHCEGKVSDEYNYAQGWKRPVAIEYFDKSSKPLNFHLSADILMSGECSLQFPKRSFSFKLKKKYGKNELDYKLYPQKDIHKIKGFKLRTGANGYRVTDILAASLVADSHLNIDYQAFHTAHMFLNGEYWGIYHIRERKDKNFIRSNYPEVDVDKLDVISVSEVKEGDLTDYDYLGSLIKNDLSVPANYQEVLKRIDVDNFIDYMCMMIFSGAQDWISNNTRLWKEKKVGAKWRWILDDVDGGFQAWSLNHNLFQRIANKQKFLTAALFTALSKNSDFKNRFKQRLVQLMDTAFSVQHIIKNIHQLTNDEKRYMQYEKWAKELSRKEKTVQGFVETFNYHIQSMIDFANRRKAIVLQQLNNY